MKLIIGSEGCGIYGRCVVDYILKKAYPGIEISFENRKDCDLILASHFNHLEPLWNSDNKKYIYWSGESYDVTWKSQYSLSELHILTNLDHTLQYFIYIPFFLYSPFLYLERKYTNSDRKLLVAYCNSNKIAEREKIFDIFVKKTSFDVCHAYGKCYGKYLKTRRRRIPGGYASAELIDTYKQYKFVIAMENKVVDGYVTEKILNAFYSGAIPIYWGTSKINEFFNKDSFINVSDFNTFEECVDYVIRMTDDEINTMRSRPIYKTDNHLCNLINDTFNNHTNNVVLNRYVQILKEFIEK